METKPEIPIDAIVVTGASKSDEKPRKKKPNNGWTQEQEELVANWSDVASCYRLLHDKTEKRFSRFNMAMTIPVIMLSTMTGTANFGMGSFFGDDMNSQKFANLAIGGVSLIAGLMTTLGNFLRYAQNMESHRVSAIAWGKFQRRIAVELALNPNERQDSMDFIKLLRNEYDRLIEQDPPIPEKIINQFEKQFRTIEIKKPDICNHLERTAIYKMKAVGLSPELMDEDIPPLVYPGSAASRIQSFIIKASSEASTPRNIIDIAGIIEGQERV